MGTKIITFLILIFTVVSLTGCWDAHELTEHSILSLVGLDFADGKYKNYIEYIPSQLQTQEMKETSGKRSKIATGEGQTFIEMRNSDLRKVPKDLFFGATRAAIFSDRFSKQGIEEYINRVRGIKEFRRTSIVFTTTSDMDKLFDAKWLETDNIGFDIDNLSNNLNKSGLGHQETASDLLEEVSTQNIGYVLSNLDLVGQRIQMTGYSIFKENKQIGLVLADKIKGVNFLILKNASRDYQVDLEGIPVSMTAVLKNKKVKPNYNNGNITFEIKISLDCEIINPAKMIKIDNNKMKVLEWKIADKVKSDIEDAIKTSQTEYNCDYLDFYKYFRAKYNSDFQRMNWNDQYKGANFNIDVKAKVKPGTMINYE